MGLFKQSAKLILAAVLVPAMSACTTPSGQYESFTEEVVQEPDHRAEVCLTFGEVQRLYTSPGTDLDEILAKLAGLGGKMAVWQMNSGEEDPLFWKISRYSQALTTLNMDITVENIDAYYIVEDADLANIETECGLPSTYVPPLTIQGGCWNNESVKVQVQELFEGEWTKVYALGELVKGPHCTDPEYPFGFEYERRRTFGEGAIKYRAIWKDPDGYEFVSGRTAHYSCTTEALESDVTIWLSGSHCGD
jgi:hypothetical protein